MQILFEEKRRVVNSSITTSELLEKLAGTANKHTLEFLSLAAGEDGLPARLGSVGRFNIGLQEVEVIQDLVGVGRDALKLSKNLASLLIQSSLHKPGWGIRKQHGTNGDNQSEEDLERHGESPLDAASGV